MNEVFSKVGEEVKSKVIMFNSEEIYELATKQSYLLSYDLIGDAERNKDLDKTNFYKLLNKSEKKLSANTELDNSYDIH